MTEEKPTAAHRRAFDQIWWQRPEQQNRTSSSWWFVILFPEGEAGYGPEQLMFAVATRVGDRVRLNGVPRTGMDLDRPVGDGVDRFDAATVGWYGDDERVHEGIVEEPATAELSRDGSITAWADRDDGTRRGGEFRASADRPLGLDARFVGEDCDVRFEAWGDLDSRITAPEVSIDYDTPLGGANLVTWRRMQFEGEFDLPDGRRTMSGLCYFQRVLLDVPLFPWKWIWALFPDGTAFSAFVPYVGPQLLRSGYTFFGSERLERATVPVRQSGLWNPGGTDRVVDFDAASVTPILNSGPHPDFAVRVHNDAGDHVEFLARPYGHARNYIDRPVLGGLAETHWSYNEYLFRMEDLEGRVDGEPVDAGTMGQGFGTLEYAWGLGL